MRSRWLIGVALGCSASCAHANPSTPNVGPMVTRPHSECGAERARASADSQLAETLKPVPTSIIMPPAGLSRDLGGKTLTVHLLVNEWGEVVADSIEPAGFSGIQDLRRALRKYRFQPAVLAGCAVPAWATISFGFAAVPN
jgi:hypothetical protein